MQFKKVKTEHHILKEFHKVLLFIEKNPHIERIIPWRIYRKQKKSSIERFRVSYQTITGIKCIISKWSTAQELFIIATHGDEDIVETFLKKIAKEKNS